MLGVYLWVWYWLPMSSGKRFGAKELTFYREKIGFSGKWYCQILPTLRLKMNRSLLRFRIMKVLSLGAIIFFIVNNSGKFFLFSTTLNISLFKNEKVFSSFNIHWGDFNLIIGGFWHWRTWGPCFLYIYLNEKLLKTRLIYSNFSNLTENCWTELKIFQGIY